MAIGIMVIILLVAAMIGGYANYLLPANSSEDGKTKLRTVWDCMTLGLAATIMVPIFLELAQSKLLENVRFSFQWEAATKTVPPVGVGKPDTVLITSLTTVDSANGRKTRSDTTVRKGEAAVQPAGDNAAVANNELGKHYWLWAAYCIVAAAAGFRFIDMLINNVVKQDEIKNLKTENKELTEKGQLEEQQNKASMLVAEKRAIEEVIKEKTQKRGLESGSPEAIRLPDIGPITHPDDPQKGRFGGLAERNFRKLEAKVTPSTSKGFYNVDISVRSTDEVNHPLKEKVIFYIHDSFRPSVYTITPVNGKAEDNEILSYGAFTVGAVADHGETLLELDLAEDPSFPKEFRES